jgi:hypothetical protein
MADYFDFYLMRLPYGYVHFGRQTAANLNVGCDN